MVSYPNYAPNRIALHKSGGPTSYLDPCPKKWEAIDPLTPQPLEPSYFLSNCHTPYIIYNPLWSSIIKSKIKMFEKLHSTIAVYTAFMETRLLWSLCPHILKYILYKRDFIKNYKVQCSVFRTDWPVHISLFQDGRCTVKEIMTVFPLLGRITHISLGRRQTRITQKSTRISVQALVYKLTVTWLQQHQ
jgi:hypothetical protein